MALKRSHWFALAVAALVAVGAGAIVAMRSQPAGPPEIAGFVYPEPKAIAPFELSKHDGTPFDPDALKGKWSFVYFGYTYCPDVCPTTLVELDRAQKSLARTGLDADNQYFFVSVDPKRDTLKRLAEYVPYFNAKFVGVTGSDPALRQFTQEVGVLYLFPQGRKGNDYLVAHSSPVLLFDPEARLHAVFTEPQKAEEMVEGFRRIRDRRS